MLGTWLSSLGESKIWEDKARPCLWLGKLKCAQQAELRLCLRLKPLPRLFSYLQPVFLWFRNNDGRPLVL